VGVQGGQGEEGPAVHWQGPGDCSAGQFAPARAEGKGSEGHLADPSFNMDGSGSTGHLGDVWGGGGKREMYGSARAGDWGLLQCRSGGC